MQNAEKESLILIRSPNDYEVEAAVQAFLASLEWSYLTHRYNETGQKNLLRLLTLSGLDVRWWTRCAMALTLPGSHMNTLLHAASEMKGDEDVVWLQQGLEAIRVYAEGSRAPVDEPSASPSYLMTYGYTKQDYLHDLQQTYGRVAKKQTEARWLEPGSDEKNRMQDRCALLHQGAAIMGATAGAIERLLANGGMNGGSNR